MTELWIDGVAAVLPTNMSVTVKRENPFFTKNGEYTYELELDLSIPQNAELYEHLNRLNSVKEINEKRKAVLIADNRVYCNGTEIVTGWTDKKVQIQLVSGNSELNYFIGSDLPIEFLNMGKAIIPESESGKLNHIVKTWPEVDFCLPPLMNSGSGEIVNQWGVEKYREGDTVKRRIIANGNTYIAQPYLCEVIKRVCKGIGYEVIQNDLANTEYRSIYFPHVEQTDEYAKMFPGWSVKELFEEIEKLYSICFVIESNKRSVRVLFNLNYYSSIKNIHVGMVTDEYEGDMEEETEATHAKSNIKYELEDNTYYAFERLKEGVMRKAKRKSFNTYEALKDYLLSEGEYKGWMIGTDISTGREYIACQPEGQIWQIKEVNRLQDLIRKNAESDISIKMIPTSFVQWVNIEIDNAGTSIKAGQGYWIPNIASSDVASTEGTNGLNDLIESNTGDSQTAQQRLLTIAFYQGLWGEYMSLAFFIKYPFSFIDCDGGEGYEVEGGSLRLVDIAKKCYDGMYEIDTSKPIKIEAYDPNLYDCRSVFEVNNKRYVCKEIEYVVTANGRKKAWTGTFYPIKISDTEAEQRWILTDGKWRDGGVWLDNGRWLDE